MPLDLINDFSERPSVAVIGAGITGLGAAYALTGTHKVTLFEAETRLGGHARTLIAGRSRQVAVDTGFIVFNRQNYPLLTGLFNELNVPVKPSDMAFSASIDDGRIEYGLHATSALFGQGRNLARPEFWRMLFDIPRFNRAAQTAKADPNMSLGALLDGVGVGEWFKRYFMLPLGCAIWSTSPADMLDFPAASFVHFFENHGLLTLHDQPQWYTVDGGSHVYVDKLAQAIELAGGSIRVGAPIEMVRRGVGAWVKPKGGEAQHFDAVIFACHSDQALRLLADADDKEKRILAALPYRPNKAYLHDDPGQMPDRRRCWASWNYRGRSTGSLPQVTVTYWMNRLQSLPTDTPLFLTLNPETPIQDECVFDETVFYHPQFDRAAIQAQQELSARQGTRNTWFCGAYTRHGFHEDGLLSGVNAARTLGNTPVWA
jgi:predicted NAD/FAD-binding protein